MERCLYVEHALFTPLVIGTNGGIGDGCEKFLKNLAELLGKEDCEEYSVPLYCVMILIPYLQGLYIANECTIAGGS